ncbi:MAG: YgaP family membrane protein [Acidimicrobiia bacterium]
MMTNVGFLDQIIRTLVLAPAAVLLAAVFDAGVLLTVVAWLFAGLMVVTAAIGYCPFYRLLGLSTAGKAEEQGEAEIRRAA